MKQAWTTSQLAFLKENYRKPYYSLEQISAHLGRTVDAIRKQAHKMGLTLRHNKIVFTKADKKYLQDNYLTQTNKELAKALGKKLTIVRNQMYKMGLQRNKRSEKLFTPGEDKVLINNYKTKGNREIALMLPGRNAKSVYKRLRVLKLVRTPVKFAKIYDRNIEKLSAYSFKKGHKYLLVNTKKIWATHRENERLSDEQILERIEKRSKVINKLEQLTGRKFLV